MKKLFTLLSIMVLVPMLLVFPVEAAQSEPGYVANADNSGIKMVAPAGTTFKIENGIFKTTSGANRPSFEIKDLTNMGMRVKEYPIIAMKIKLQKADSVFGGFDVATDDSLYAKSMGANIGSYPIKVTSTYKPTTDWQLVTGDLSSYFDKYSSVGGVDYYWIDDDSQYKFNIVNTMSALIPGQDDTFYIEWVGYFKTVGDAQAYYNNASPSETTKPQTDTTAADTTNKSDTTRVTTTKADTTRGSDSTTAINTNASSNPDMNNSSPYLTVLIWVIVIIILGAVAVYVIFKIKKSKV